MRVAIAAGGTGGHLFPAEALASSLGARGHAVALITDRRTAERARQRFAEVHVVDGGGLVGRSPVAAARNAAALARGTLAARRVLARMRADAVVGFGGYPSVPPVLAARLAQRPRPAIVLHDQNAVLGSANRFLARFADTVATSFPEVAGLGPRTRRDLVGNPVRAAIAAIGPYAPPASASERVELLVLGGSLGARVFSDVVPAVVTGWAARTGRPVRIAQQARPEDVERVRAAYAGSGVEAEIAPFFADVASLLARAHLVIGRSGGSTVAELAACGRPSLLVPLPIAANDEQSGNARALVASGAAWMTPQKGFTAAWLGERLGTLLDAPDLLAQAAASARAQAIPLAAENLARLVEDLASARYDVKRPIREHFRHDGEGIGA